MCSFRIYRGVVLFSVLIACCGVKSAPVPRETVVPVPVEDVELTVTSEGIKLEWTLPVRSLDGSPLKGLAGYKVVREGPDGKKIREEVWFHISERKNMVGEKVLFIDAPPKQKGIYYFWVIPFDAYGSSPRPGQGVTVNWEGSS
jgi:hypothetical protein